MTTRRDAILTGASRAAELHRELGLRDQLTAGDRPVDVIEALHLAGLVILFRPLKGLLGAYVPNREASGVLITSERSLHIQRLTAAHELGHHVLGHHALSLDREGDVGFVAREESSKVIRLPVVPRDPQEIEADAFASEFLLPAWLIVSHARKQRWGKNDLSRPEITYQLSLRLGASYSATCWALATNGILPNIVVRELLKASPKSSKQKAIPDVEPDHWRADVWQLTENDRGSQLLGNPDDLLVLALEEHVSAGYAWNPSGLSQAGLMVKKDERKTEVGEKLGGSVTRRLIAQGPVVGHVKIEETRLWDLGGPTMNSFELDLAMIGAQQKGLPRFLPRRAA